jgi:hypothetical protein
VSSARRFEAILCRNRFLLHSRLMTNQASEEGAINALARSYSCPRRLVLTFLSLSVAVSGCGLAPREKRASPTRCKSQAGEPLTVGEVRQALRSSAFKRSELVYEPVCSARMIAEISNIHFRGPYANVSDHDVIRATEGHVGCIIEEHADDQAPISMPKINGGPHDDEVTGRYANVECKLYPAGPNREEQVARLRLALDRMRAFT